MEKQPFQTPNEMMVLGLMEHAEIVTKALQVAQQGLGEQIGELTQLKQWSAEAAVRLHEQATARAIALRQQAEVILKGLEAERLQLHGLRPSLERAGAEAIRSAVRSEVGEIGTATERSMAGPLEQIRDAATAVRQNVKDASRLLLAGVFSLGLVFGLFSGYGMVVRTQNRMDGRLDLIENYLARQAEQAPAATTLPVPVHPGKKK